MLVMLSPVLDLTDNTMLLELARLLCCVKILVSHPLVPHGNQVKLTNIPRLAMAYSTHEYHEKPISDFFAITGAIQTSLFHFFKVMSRLHSDSQSKLYTVFPYCVREFMDDIQETALLFPNLSIYNYQIGLPKSRAQRESFLYHCKHATACFHQVGVVHLDLYLSNIMWREISDTEVQLKFIDWDAALFINECLIPGLVQERLLGRRTDVRNKSITMDIENCSLRYPPNAEDNLRYFDVSMIHVLEAYLEDESLQATDKNCLGKALALKQIDFIRSV